MVVVGGVRLAPDLRTPRFVTYDNKWLAYKKRLIGHLGFMEIARRMVTPNTKG